MARVLGFLSASFLFFAVSVSSSAVEFTQEGYEVYLGDVNEDGIDDVYFKAKEKVLPMHSDVVIPVVVPGGDSYVMYGEGDYFYDPVIRNDVDLSGLRLTNKTEFYDHNQDGTLDVVLDQQAGVPGKLAVLGGSSAQLDTKPGAPTTPYVSSVPVSFAHVKNLTPADKVGNSKRYVPIAGEFRVSESGAATYRVPISVPAGTAGVTPDLSLDYSSQAGNGVVGLGWSLSGVSAITRCGQSFSVDGNATPISWNAKDRFCYKGQPLIVKTGAYGSPGSTYTTLIDGFMTITAKGGSAGDPHYFLATGKDGSTTAYGRTGDSSLNHPNGKTYRWSINEVKDNIGNRITYHYGKGSGSQLLSAIRYGSAVKYGSGVSNPTPHSEVQLVYADRPADKPISYISGLKIKLVKRLSSIVVKSSSSAGGSRTPIRRYNLTYDKVNTDYSRLVKIHECSGVSSAGWSNCRAATKFEWEYPLTGLSSGKTLQYSLGSTGFLDFKPADINGDGLTDLAYIRPTGGGKQQVFAYALSDGSKLQLIRDFEDRHDDNWEVKLEVIDYNVDGRSDVLLYSSGAAQPWVLYLSVPTAQGWRLQRQAIELPFTEEDISFGDINSDGLIDSYWFDRIDMKLNVHLLKKSGNGYASNKYYKFSDDPIEISIPLTQIPRPTGEEAEQYCNFSFYPGGGGGTGIKMLPGGVGDYNADGKMDLLFSATIKYRVDLRDDFQKHPASTDANGSVDAAVCRSDRVNLRVFSTFSIDVANKSAELIAIVNDSFLDGTDSAKVKVADVNNDGNSDILVYESALQTTHGHWRFYLNSGGAFKEQETLLSGYKVSEKGQFIDINGDGYKDFVWHDFENKRLRSRHWMVEAEKFSGTKEIPAYSTNLTNLDYVYSDNTTVAYQNYAPRAKNYFETTGKRQDSYFFLSLRGNGVSDLMFLDASEKKLWAFKNAQQDTGYHVIDGITSGLGNRTEISYEAIANSDHYTSADAGTAGTETTRVCWPDPFTGAESCFDHTYETFDSATFYTRLNNPFAGLSPEALGVATKVPTLEANGGLNVVTTVSSSSPTHKNPNAMATVSYHYDQHKAQAGGRGSLGFKRLTTYDHQTNIKTVTSYRQDFPLVGSPIETQSIYNDKALTSATNQWAIKQLGQGVRRSYFPYIIQATEKTAKIFSKPGDFRIYSPNKTVINKSLYDNFGNLDKSVITTHGGGMSYTQTTDNDWGDNQSTTESKKLGRLKASSVAHQRSNYSKPPAVRKASFEYYGFYSSHCSAAKFRGMLCKERTNPGSSAQLTKTYTYDNNGNQTKIAATGNNGYGKYITRNAYTSWDTNGRTVKQEKNHYEQITSNATSLNNYGMPLSVTNMLGKVSRFEYDELGEKYLEYNPDGSYTYSYRSARDTKHCPGYAAYQENHFGTGGKQSLVCYDKMGKELVTATLLSGNVWSHVAKRYDVLGRVVQISEPYLTDDVKYWTHYTYDILGNVVKVDAPNYAGNNRVTTTAYNGYTKTTFNPLGQKKIEVTNSLGELTKVTDNLGSTIEYSYNHVGDLVTTKTTAGPLQTKITVAYDDYGNKTKMVDPDKGTWDYLKYNAFGELLTQRDGNNTTVTMSYDMLGRLLTKNTPNDGSSKWIYNNTANGTSRGQLQKEIKYNSGGATVYQKTYHYDGFGRVSKANTSLAGQSFTQKSTYDRYGRPLHVQDAAATNNSVKYLYDGYGHLKSVVDAANYSKLYYQVLKVDARNNVTEYKQSAITTYKTYNAATGYLHSIQSDIAGVIGLQKQNYTWDAIGNMRTRNDRSGSKKLFETFHYDGLNRLKDAQVGGQTKQLYIYDKAGNITFKTGVGKYKYGAACANPAGPHAVCEIEKTGTKESFDYDDNGNLLAHKINNKSERTFKYTNFNKPKQINLRGNAHITKFDYDANDSRYRRVDIDNGGATTTLYIGSVEKVIKPDKSYEIRRYINGNTLITQEYGAANNLKRSVVRHILKDHLGTTDLIVDSSGEIKQEQSFDAWGMRRATHNGKNYNFDALASLADASNEFTTQGYTGHEAVDQVGIIHMNGRIYDPRLARFLQADPIIDGTTSVHGYNRYAYVHNSPLIYSDPSGFSIGRELKKVAGLVVAAALVYFTGPTFTGQASWFVSSWYGAATLGAISGAVQAGANGGNVLEGAMWGAISGAAFYGIGQAFRACTTSCTGSYLGTEVNSATFYGRIASHAVAGGVLSDLQGGKFGHGFFSAGFSKAVMGGLKYNDTSPPAVAGRTLLAAMVGGTVSRVTGGKFANGAATAALAHLVNQEASAKQQQRKVSLWDAVKEGGSAKVGPGAGMHLKEVKMGPLKAGGGVVVGSGGVGLDSEGLSVWGKSTADVQLSFGRFGGRVYLWDIDIDSAGVNNIDTFGGARPEWDWSVGVGATITPYSFEIEYDFQPIIDYFRGGD